jgi:hypothetical protein
MTVETEANGESKSTNERGSFLVVRWTLHASSRDFFMYGELYSDRCLFLLCKCGRERGLERGGGNLYCTGTVGISTVLAPPSRVQLSPHKLATP